MFLCSYKLRLFLFVFLVCTTFGLQAQDDNIAWLSVSGRTQIQKDLSFTLTPIIRLNEDFGAYQNYSLDYAFKKKLNSNWSFQVLGRTWFLPNGTKRQFFWPEFSYGHKLNDISWIHRVRWHHAFDIQDRVDPDFIRYYQAITYTGWGKFQPFIGLELWWGLNGTLQIERLRYIPGISYKISDSIKLSAAYWRQESLNLDPVMDVNIWRVNLAFNLPDLWKEK